MVSILKRKLNFDARTLGILFWDQPSMSNQEIEVVLNKPGTFEYYSLLTRLVERLSAKEVLEFLDQKALYAEFPKLHVWRQYRNYKVKEFFENFYEQAL